MLEQPGIELLFEAASEFRVAPHPLAERIAGFAQSYVANSGLEVLPGVLVTVKKALPSHFGLGSGTQLGLAVAKGLAAWHGENGIPAHDLALRVGRGKRSAIGLYGFDLGGLIVDGGQPNSGGVAPLLAHLPFPSEWRFLLVMPVSEPGISGSTEQSVFDSRPSTPKEVLAELTRLILWELLPAATEANFGVFARALGEYGRLAGEPFVPAQGGLYTDRRMARLAEWLELRGHQGVGQSSWGPVMYALCPNQEAAEGLRLAILATGLASSDEMLISAAAAFGAKCREVGCVGNFRTAKEADCR
jgi:beta-ribofuranosylaminobenzene 5'-phosphate synthase